MDHDQAGRHIGECDVRGQIIGGAAVRLAQQISEIATANDVLVTGTVKDLVAGSGIKFVELTMNDVPEKFAASRLRRETPGQTLQPTALVHEVYLRLVASKEQQNWDSAGHFFGAASESMRRILADRAGL